MATFGYSSIVYMRDIIFNKSNLVHCCIVLLQGLLEHKAKGEGVDEPCRGQEAGNAGIDIGSFLAGPQAIHDGLMKDDRRARQHQGREGR